MEALRGVVHGRMIELENEPGLPDGQIVTVVVQSANIVSAAASASEANAELHRAFGAWADDADELDEYLEWNRQQRHCSRQELEP